MAITFREVTFAPLHQFSVSAPDGAVIGIIGESGSGASEVLRLAAGVARPASGEVIAHGERRALGPADALECAPAAVLTIEHSFARHDAVERARAAAAIERLRRSGSTVLLLSNEPDLLTSLCDEVWWIDQGRLAAKGHPQPALEQYQRHVATRVRALGEGAVTVSPAMRRGDGRARVVALETLGENGKPTSVWRSGEEAAVRVSVRFEQAVADPVVGIMIRTRIGFEVYGTNTELEKIKLGPCAAGETRHVTFSFRCLLCAQEYTLTAASHDPDGVWHDWLEDALAFAVVDSRYTAGVANLVARVTVG